MNFINELEKLYISDARDYLKRLDFTGKDIQCRDVKCSRCVFCEYNNCMMNDKIETYAKINRISKRDVNSKIYYILYSKTNPPVEVGWFFD